MLLSTIAISFTLKRLVIPWFVFFVKPENFNKFKEEPQIKCLETYFKDIRILIVCEDSNFQSLNKEPKFSNFLSKNVNFEKNNIGEIKSPESITNGVKNNTFVLPLSADTEDILNNETPNLFIEGYVTFKLSLVRPLFVSSEFIWNNISCSVNAKGVIIRNPNKISNNLFVKNSEVNVDENEEVDSNENNNPNNIFFENSKNNLNENKSSIKASFVESLMLKNLDYCNFAFYKYQNIFNFAKEYFSLLPKSNSLSNKIEHFIIQRFSIFFHPSAIPRLLYGLLLNLRNITLDQKNVHKNYYSLQLHFDNTDDLDTAKNVLKKFKNFFINPVKHIN
jgi:hypothetical protein